MPNSRGRPTVVTWLGCATPCALDRHDLRSGARVVVYMQGRSAHKPPDDVGADPGDLVRVDLPVEVVGIAGHAVTERRDLHSIFGATGSRFTSRVSVAGALDPHDRLTLPNAAHRSVALDIVYLSGRVTRVMALVMRRHVDLLRVSAMACPFPG